MAKRTIFDRYFFQNWTLKNQTMKEQLREGNSVSIILKSFPKYFINDLDFQNYIITIFCRKRDISSVCIHLTKADYGFRHLKIIQKRWLLFFVFAKEWSYYLRDESNRLHSKKCDLSLFCKGLVILSRGRVPSSIFYFMTKILEKKRGQIDNIISKKFNLPSTSVFSCQCTETVLLAFYCWRK